MVRTPAFYVAEQNGLSPGVLWKTIDLVKRNRWVTFSKRSRPLYLDHAVKTYNSVARSTDIERLLQKFPGLGDDEVQSINTYFDENGTLVGLAMKFRAN